MVISSTKEKLTYQVFGSESSQDLDVCFFEESLGSIAENANRISEILNTSDIITDKPINANLAIVRNGIVWECFKGIPDELNNSLFTTYELHEQKHVKCIRELVPRDMNLKMNRCARTIVSYFTRTHLRVEAKSALRNSFNAKINFLSDIKLAKFSDYGKHGAIEEIYKSMSFQLGQTLGLVEGVELYTKESIFEKFPDLSDYLFRKTTDSINLQSRLEQFVDQARLQIKEG